MWSWKYHVGHLGAPKYHGGCLGATPPNFHFQPGSDKKWAVNTPGPCRNVETPMHSPPDKKVAVVRLNWTKFDGAFCWNPFEIISTQCIGAASQPYIKSEWGLIRVDQLWMQWGKRAPPKPWFLLSMCARFIRIRHNNIYCARDWCRFQFIIHCLAWACDKGCQGGYWKSEICSPAHPPYPLARHEMLSYELLKVMRPGRVGEQGKNLWGLCLIRLGWRSSNQIWLLPLCF